MQIRDLNKEYDKLQDKYGSKDLSAITNGGCENGPDICFVFMNPTGKNVASLKTWKGRKSPWIGTKNVWKLFANIGLLDEKIAAEIQKKKASEWDYEFADKVYKDVEDKRYFITNLGKCTQVDARPLPDEVFSEYLGLLHKEIDIIRPRMIVSFGNQVSSLLLESPINVSRCRKRSFRKGIGGNTYDVFPVYYPVGNGMRNMALVLEDLRYILKEER